MERYALRILTLLSSRRLSAYLLGLLLAGLLLSAFLPGDMTMSARDWASFAEDHPLLGTLSKHLSTPRLVRNPVFLFLAFFLFVSTLACTLTRIRARVKQRRLEYEKEQAFSFSLERHLAKKAEFALGEIRSSLARRRWQWDEPETGAETKGTARRGSTLGFWGSIVFHVGLLIGLIAAPVTALTVFRAQFVAPEGVPLALRDGITVHEGKPIGQLPDLTLTLRDLKGVYEKGLYNLDFSGVIDTGLERHPIAVNRPAVIDGYHFLFHEFGYSTQVVISKQGQVVFDYLLNLRQGPEGDVFDIPGVPYRLFTVLMPDFFRDGIRIGTRSNNPENPVLLVRLLEGEREVATGLVGIGESKALGDYTVSFPDLTNWANLIVVRERGVAVLGAGLLVGVLGLLFRFLSNERILEFDLMPGNGGCRMVLRGYSKYYPAFLEREVRELAGSIERGEYGAG